MNTLIKYILISAFVLSAFQSCGEAEPELSSKEIHDLKYPVEIDPDAYVFKEGEKIHWNVNFNEGVDLLTIQFGLVTGWKTYSCYNQNNFGPLPTYITFEPSDDYELIDEIKESLVKKQFDKEADEELLYFEHSGLFVQKIKIKTEEKFVLKGNINYMLCNNVGCDPPTDYEFEIEITPTSKI